MNERDFPESYVHGALALQGMAAGEGVPDRVATALAAQMRIVAPVYATLAFEDEPAGFLRVRDALAR
jgi:hypothetical protein